MKIIKSHVTTFKDEKEQFNFLRHFHKKQNQDIYINFSMKKNLIILLLNIIHIILYHLMTNYMKDIIINFI